MDYIDYMIKYHREKLTECDRCGNLELYMQTLLPTWQRHELVNICSKCEPEANSFFSYYGKKKQKDIDNLYKYLINGSKQTRIFSSLMNGGYY